MRRSLLALAMCVSAQAFAPSFIGQGLALRQAHGSALSMKIELAPLPYGYTDLEPKIGKRTLEIHHDKHHAKYVNVANQMIEGTDMENDDCATIVMKAHKSGNQALFNNAAQSWNHDFYWKSMKQGGGGVPSGALATQITKDFGSYEEFRKQFDTAGNTAFGSGWAWLSWDGSKLVVDKTIGAGNPITEGKTPLVTMDVWEHAYYLDALNKRNDYIVDFLDTLVNWDFASANFAAATGEKADAVVTEEKAEDILKTVESEVSDDPETKARFDLKKNFDKSKDVGAGFNQFDPVLSVTSFVSRRFGLVGGLAVVAILASTEGKDIVKALLAEKPQAGTGEVFETENGVEYEDVLVGPPGDDKEPAVGKLVGMTVEVTIADQKFKKNVAFKYGSRPFQSLVCAGLEEGIQGMTVGGRRKLKIPLNLAPAGMKLPPGIALEYDVTLNEVFDNYLN